MSILSGHYLRLPLALGLVVWLSEVSVTARTHINVDSNGYILYCPCLGRFGNQVDTLLGMLPFTKALNRTLVLPHWVEFRAFGMDGESIQMPFDKYFKVEPLKSYHRVITMKTFMRHLAPTIWPPSARQVTCYEPMNGPKPNDCNPHYRSPTGPFWATSNVTFIGSQFYDSIINSFSDYDLENTDVLAKWTHRFKPKRYPVVAFLGAPVLMPVHPRYNHLQGLLVWSDSVRNQAEGFVSNNIPSKPFLGVHIRHNQEWAQFCYSYFARQTEWNARSVYVAYQCLGSNNEVSMAQIGICVPSDEVMLIQLERALIETKVASLFVASDDHSMVAKLKQDLKKMKVSVVGLTSPSPHVDLAILAMADYFIGNCVSTFTGFVVRDRLVHDRPYAFWGMNGTRKHDEL